MTPEHLGPNPEIKRVPKPILFHGTTISRFERLLTPEGDYTALHGNKLWLDEQLVVPLTWAESYQREHNSDALLVVVRSDMLSLRQGSMPGFWSTDRLPAGSFVPYNLTQDPHGLFTNVSELDSISAPRFRRALQALPEYAGLFTK